MKSQYFNLFFAGIFILITASCSKMNDLHDEYLRRGETIYTGQTDSVKAFAGHNRVMLRYWSSDPKATKLIVYWNTNQDSVVLDIPSKARNEFVDVTISDLAEKKYFFELVTANDEMQNRSIPFKVSVNAVGSKFQESLLDRGIKYANYVTNNKVLISWNGSAEYGVGTDVTYTDISGKTIEKYIPIKDVTTLLEDYKENLKYRTVFLPDTNAIDNFYTEFKEVTKIDRQLDKGLFRKWNPSDIPYHELNSTYSITKMWDNDIPGTFYIATVPRLPYNFTFDLGQLKRISRIKQWQRLTNTVVYRIQNVSKFEVWGSSTPDVTSDFSGWTRLGVFTSRKPSGAPVGTETPEDIAYATAGEDFMVYPVSEPIRYIRYVVLDNWDHKTTFAIGEISFFSLDN